MAYDLAGTPAGVKEGAVPSIFHSLSLPGREAIWSFIKDEPEEFPLLAEMSHQPYGPSGRFALDKEGQEALVRQIDGLRESVRASVRSSFASRDSLDEVALDELHFIRAFVEEVVKRGWMLHGEPD